MTWLPVFQLVYWIWAILWSDITAIECGSINCTLGKTSCCYCGWYLFSVGFSSKLTFSLKSFRLDKQRLVFKFLRSMLVSKSLWLFELASLFYFETDTFQLIDSRNITYLSCIYFSINKHLNQVCCSLGKTSNFLWDCWVSRLFVDLEQHSVQKYFEHLIQRLAFE